MKNNTKQKPSQCPKKQHKTLRDLRKKGRTGKGLMWVTQEKGVASCY